ncbi:vWA domain-containing protein [Mycolicibacterium palauense]|uniref:vWA domain-containing protein n=1 Tax=Mycolicibacterium palauense TaxID=2034511 RepID=UPI000BFEB88F|nr:VWA domain-containing protein [Mycolicibacterium palauense]
MKLSVAPVFPIWLIVVLVVVAMALRVAAVVAARRRHGRLPERRAWLRLAAGLAAIACLGVAATRVGDESRAERPPRLTATAEESNLNVFLVVDRSMGMTAQDFDGNQERMAGAIQDMETVLGKYPKARFGVISYADSARVEWPLSPDVWSLIPFVDAFTPYGGPYGTDGDSQLDTIVSASSSVLRGQLNRAVHDYPGSANLVYLFGSPSDPGDWAFDIPAGQVSGGAVFGYGTEDGATVFYRPRDRSEGTRLVRSELNEPALRTAADSLGVPFEHRESGPLPSGALASVVPQAAPVDPIDPAVPHPNRVEFYWLFAGLAAALFGVELYGLARHWIRRRGGGFGR